MIKYRLYAPNDGDTMTVDGGGGGGWVSNDDRKGGSDRNNDKSDSQVDYGKNPEKQTVINPYLFFAIPPAVYLIDDVWGFTFNTAAIEVGLKKVADFALKAAPVAGRLVGILGAIMPSDIAPDSIDPVFNGMQQTKMAQLAAQLAARKGVPNTGYSVTAMPADLVSSLPVSEMRSLTTAPASLLAQSVINTELSRRQLTLTQPAVNSPVANIPVVKAEKTAVPGVYSVKIIADKPALQIKLDKTQPALVKNPPKVKDDVQVSSFLSTPVADTHHAFIDFGSDHEPVYVSLSKIVTAEEEKKQVEEAKRREQEWLLRHPVAAAERKLSEINERLNKTNDEIKNAQSKLNELKVTPEYRTIQSPEKSPYSYRYTNYYGKDTIVINNQGDLDMLLAEGGASNLAISIGIIKPAMEGRFDISDEGSALNFLKGMSLLTQASDNLRNLLLGIKNGVEKTEQVLSNAMESRKKAEQDKKSADQKLKDEQETKRKGVRETGHKYHPNPDTSEIKGLGELKEGRAKTPKQGGGGKRARWIGEKGRKIYEWDSQHGELEGYRASDGQHLGAFDPKTGEQLKPADPKRNIKKYL
ncbi:colicin E3/pyocin S6 family cytotoxin [Pectobacterium punjabense]|uniref:colicin E3/pyocin S6 family cytotoxin n=1 Tax=Pectobacterium punjabense TaxID=2108399 RepID=UPI002406A9AA|nr:colicin E3/pyocin S6 family cytotoxin [Pectobacterium punjabense]MDG0795652.1 colicin E3/pyocin S6 family cytotoxin [Pectobacterium punjabense]